MVFVPPKVRHNSPVTPFRQLVPTPNPCIAQVFCTPETELVRENDGESTEPLAGTARVKFSLVAVKVDAVVTFSSKVELIKLGTVPNFGM